MKWWTILLIALSSALVSTGTHRPRTPSPPPHPPTVPVRASRPIAGSPEVKLLERFDSNKDGWLNAVERKDARWEANPGGQSAAREPRNRASLPAPAKGESILAGGAPRYPGVPFYDEGVVRTLFLTFENADWEQELEDFHGTDIEVPATLMVDGLTYRDVGVRFRGLSSYMTVPRGYKRSLNVSVDMAHRNQNVMGYRTLNLLNSHEDPTFMRAVLFLHIARDYIAAPKANFVRVVINGENWGIYANVQQFNKDFLKENFGESDGARWKAPGSPAGQSGLQYIGEDPAPYKTLYEIKSKDDDSQWSALIQLARVLHETPPSELEAALDPLLDVEGVLRFLALEMALVNNDGYWTRASDYSIYRDPAGKFHIIPHDANETFAAGASAWDSSQPEGRALSMARRTGRLESRSARSWSAGRGGITLNALHGLQDASKPLRSKLLAAPAFRERYLSHVQTIASKWLDWKNLGPLVHRYGTLLDAHVYADTRKLSSYAAFTAGISDSPRSLRVFAEERRAFLLRGF